MKNLFKTIILGLGLLTVANASVNLGACKGCHGVNFEKSALGKSKVVSQLSKEEIETALIGYKNGTFGGPMKGIMKGQVSRYSEEDLKKAAAGIEELTKEEK